MAACCGSSNAILGTVVGFAPVAGRAQVQCKLKGRFRSRVIPAVAQFQHIAPGGGQIKESVQWATGRKRRHPATDDISIGIEQPHIEIKVFRGLGNLHGQLALTISIDGNIVDIALRQDACRNGRIDRHVGGCTITVVGFANFGHRREAQRDFVGRFGRRIIASIAKLKPVFATSADIEDGVKRTTLCGRIDPAADDLSIGIQEPYCQINLRRRQCARQVQRTTLRRTNTPPIDIAGLADRSGYLAVNGDETGGPIVVVVRFGLGCNCRPVGIVHRRRKVLPGLQLIHEPADFLRNRSGILRPSGDRH